jgi:hypothetical protein
MAWLGIAGAFVVRGAAGGLLFLGGYSKLRAGHPIVLRLVRSYDLLPEAFVNPWARALPIFEIGIGAATIVGLGGRLSAVACLLLYGLITGAAASVLARGKQISCGCVGRNLQQQILRWPIVIRNAALMVATLALASEGSWTLVSDRFASLRLVSAAVLLLAATAGGGAMRRTRAGSRKTEAIP